MSLNKNIRLKYKRKAGFSVLFLLFLILIWCLYPFQEFFSPEKIAGERINTSLPDDARYLEISDITLYYTGYCNKNADSPKGYFYYGFVGDSCLFFLLKNDTCHNGQESIQFSSIRGSVYRNSAVSEHLISCLSEDLSWDSSALTEISVPYIINETTYSYGYHIFLLIIFTTLFTGALLKLAADIVFMLKPGLAFLPVCGFSPKRAIRFLVLAEKELREHCLFTAGSFSVTRRFLIHCSPKNPLVIPIRKILWVYEHSHVSGFSGHRGKISYTLTFHDRKKRSINCIVNNKEDADTILSYLKDYYPDILNGYSEDNKKAFREIFQRDRRKSYTKNSLMKP